jgi:hypothetical protein
LFLLQQPINLRFAMGKVIAVTWVGRKAIAKETRSQKFISALLIEQAIAF